MRNLNSKNVKKAFPVLLALSGLVSGIMLWGCGTGSEEEPTLTIVTPANNSTVAGPNVLLTVKTTHFTFGGVAVKRSAVEHGDITGGHVHIYLDKPIGLDADAYDNLTKADTLTIKGLAPGKHYINVQGATANHDDVESMVDSVSFTVTAVAN
jgi:hypothetical protein